MSNRQHLFRGKLKDNGEWIEGYLYRISEIQNPFIMLKNRCAVSYEVIPETIGEWTGLCDKNGVKIFEDDIVKVPSFKPEVMHIGFIEGAFCLTDLNGKYAADIHYIHPAGVNESEVIGNIHDNPELLEVSKC